MEIEIPKTRLTIPEFLSWRGYRIGIELGVRMGSYSTQLLRQSTLQKLYSVDQWNGERRHDIREYFKALSGLNKFGIRSVVLRMSFEEAFTLFPDQYFDFIHIDGYSFEDDVNEKTINAWWQKLKSYGFYTGHEYHPNFPIKEIIDEFVREKRMKLYTTQEGKSSCWMIIKEE